MRSRSGHGQDAASGARSSRTFRIEGVRLGDELGRGADSVVFRAERDGRTCAVKVLTDGSGPGDVTAFAREAALLASLRHPGLVDIHAVGQADGRPYLVMELVEGRSLSRVLHEERLDGSRVAAVGAQVADILGVAHGAGLVHRDVKPDNILIEAEMLRLAMIELSGTLDPDDVTRRMIELIGRAAPVDTWSVLHHAEDRPVTALGAVTGTVDGSEPVVRWLLSLDEPLCGTDATTDLGVLVGPLGGTTYAWMALPLLARGERRRSRPTAAVMVDIDLFKKINDTHGHAVGDEVIREVASRLSRCLREEDVICRYGGEEFAVLLSAASAEQAAVVAARLHSAVSGEPVDTAAGSLDVTVSVGVTTAGLGPADPQALLNEADQALYAAKRSGRDQVVTAPVAPVQNSCGPADAAG